MDKKLKKRVFKGKPKEVVEQINEAIKSEVVEDNTSSIAINAQLLFEMNDLPPEEVARISEEMQSLLNEVVKGIADDLGLKEFAKNETLTKGQVEAVGRVNGKPFRALVTKDEL